MMMPIAWPVLSAGWWLALCAGVLLIAWLRDRANRANLVALVLVGLGSLFALHLDSAAFVAKGSLPVTPTLLIVLATISSTILTARKAAKVRSALVQLGLVVGSLLFALPLIWMVLTSLRHGDQLSFSDPELEFWWGNYTQLPSYLPAETHFGVTYLLNTVYLCALTVSGTVLSSSLVAYGFARFNFPFKNLLFTLLLGSMMLPAAVTLLPTFFVFKSLGWIDSLRPLWVPAWFGSAFNIFLLRQFITRLPIELEEAAQAEGANPLAVYWSVLLPQLKPIITAISVWTFVGTWNSFQGPLIYVNSVEKMPIAYGLQLFVGDKSSDPSLLMAASTLVFVPVLILFFLTQRYFMERVSLAGAVKNWKDS